MLVSGDMDGLKEFFWKVGYSSGSDKKRVILDLLPYVLVIAVLHLVPYSTSGVSATVSTKQGRSVTVIGSLYNATTTPIETLSVDALVSLRQGEVKGGAAPLLLGSPELGNYGTNTTGLEWSLTFSTRTTTDDSPNLTMYGSTYTSEQDGEGNGDYGWTDLNIGLTLESIMKICVYFVSEKARHWVYIFVFVEEMYLIKSLSEDRLPVPSSNILINQVHIPRPPASQ